LLLLEKSERGQSNLGIVEHVAGLF
jgi:hypothetical protein